MPKTPTAPGHNTLILTPTLILIPIPILILSLTLTLGQYTLLQSSVTRLSPRNYSNVGLSSTQSTRKVCYPEPKLLITLTLTLTLNLTLNAVDLQGDQAIHIAIRESNWEVGPNPNPNLDLKPNPNPR